MQFARGTEIVRGQFFVRRGDESSSLHSCHLEKGKAAIVYSATACYIFPALKRQVRNNTEVIQLPEELHLDICESLDEFYCEVLLINF